MSNLKCPACGSVLLQEVSQLRSDDEAGALVRWCPIHGLHYNLCLSYLSLKLALPFTLYLSPSRLLVVVPSVAPKTQTLSNINFGHSWTQCCIDLKTPADIASIEGARTVTFEYVFANDSINVSGLIKHVHIWDHHPVALSLYQASYCRAYTIEHSKNITCVLETVRIASVNGNITHTDWNVVSGTITWVEPQTDGVVHFIITVSNTVEFFAVYTQHIIKQMGLGKHALCIHSQALSE